MTYERSISSLRKELVKAQEALQQKQEDERPLYAAMDAAEEALMHQVLKQLLDGGDYLALAVQVHGVTEATKHDAQTFGRNLADRLGRYFQNRVYTSTWRDSSL